MNLYWRRAAQALVRSGIFVLLGSGWVAAQTAPQNPSVAWPDNPKFSGNAFLPSGLLKLQDDLPNSPVSLWLDRGTQLWADSTRSPSCQSCHGGVESLKQSAGTFPRLAKAGSATTPAGGSETARLINLEDQIVSCSAKGGRIPVKAEDDELLALSALLHNAAKGLAIDLKPPADTAEQWDARLQHGAKLFSTRLGRINLACVHCHDQNIGRQMRLDVVSPANPTGFPIYRMSWQRLGSVERRLRACYSGVQAVLPATGHSDLRDLELYLKVRANGLLLEGPSIRR